RPSARIRHAGRRARLHALRRTAPARLPRSGDPDAPAGPAPGRPLREHRLRDRGGDPRGARADRRPHADRGRTPGLGRGGGRPDRGPRGREDRRARASRGASRREGALRHAVRAPAHGRGDREGMSARPSNAPPPSARAARPERREDDEVLGKAYDARLMRRLLAFVRPHAHLVAVSGLLLVFVSGAQLLQPYLIKLAIDGPIAKRTFTGLDVLVLLYVGTIVVELTLRYLQVYTTELTGQNVVTDLRAAVFAHLQALSSS